MDYIRCADCGIEFQRNGKGRPRKRCGQCSPPAQPVTFIPRVCALCGLAPAVKRGKFCSDQCRMRSRQVPCASCGKPIQKNTTSAESPRCRDCWHAVPCGEVNRYRKGCRCDACREAQRLYMRDYVAMVRERDGALPPRKSRPTKGRTCDWCGSSVTGKAGVARDGLVLCQAHRVEKRLRDRVSTRRHERRRREAEVLAAKAAKGVPANPRWPFVQGTCEWCGEYFVRRGASSPFCSSSCSHKDKRRRNRKTYGRQWISDAGRFAIYERDSWTCQLCGDPVDRTLDPKDVMAATLDHIECRSWALIPDDSSENLRLAHRSCNSKRGNRAA